MLNKTPCAKLLAMLVSMATSAAIYGQAPASTSRPGETVELSPFEVNAPADRGYVASETMTGSRVKTLIVDLPYTVNVMTSEFMADFGIFELSDNVTQIGGFTGLDVGGNFVLRGFTSNNQLRDGFFRLGRYGSSNIDRIEIIKGSSAAIYGRSSAGGMMNIISKSPKAAASQSVSYNYGDYDTRRLTFEGTGPLLQDVLGKTNYVATASNYRRGFDAPYSSILNKEYYFAADHVFKNGDKLTLSIEDFHQDRASPLSPAPVIIDQKGTATTTDDKAIGYALKLGRYNAYGPFSQLNRSNRSYTAIYEKNLDKVFSLRTSGNVYSARRNDFNQNQPWQTVNVNRPGGLTPTSTRGTANSVPNWGRINEDGGAFQADLLAHYWALNNKVENRTLVTFDFNDYYRWDPTLNYSATTQADILTWNRVRTVTLSPDLIPIDPLAYFPRGPDAAAGFVSTRNMKRRITVAGGLIRHQSAFIDGRLLAYAGARYDSVRFRHHDYLTAASGFTPFVPGYQVGDLIDKTLSSLKPNVGVNYKLTDNVRVYANLAQSYFLSQGDNPVDIVDPTFKAETATGWDYGFKGALLENRLNYTVSGFYITRQNVQVSDIDPLTGLTVNRRDGDQLVRGYEADINWQATSEVSLLLSYGNVHSLYTNFGAANPQAIGRKVQYVAPYNGSVSAKYTPSRGWLKGFSANVGVTFVGETPTETPIAGDTLATVNGARVVTSSTDQWKLTAPTYNLWSLGVRYSLRGKSSYTHTFALNVNNALDKDYFRAGTSGATRILTGDRRAFFITYTLGHKGNRF
jgi:iron complex outermembrane receptor protein